MAVTLFNAKGIQPDATLALNATCLQLRSQRQTNVNLQIQINGAVIASSSIAKINSGSSYSMVYNWTPTVEGKYNITVYATPVAGEQIVENNVKTTFVPVIQKIALISDNYELDRYNL